jgi:hypothetical protein
VDLRVTWMKTIIAATLMVGGMMVCLGLKTKLSLG